MIIFIHKTYNRRSDVTQGRDEYHCHIIRAAVNRFKVWHHPAVTQSYYCSSKKDLKPFQQRDTRDPRTELRCSPWKRGPSLPVSVPRARARRPKSFSVNNKLLIHTGAALSRTEETMRRQNQKIWQGKKRRVEDERICCTADLRFKCIAEFCLVNNHIRRLP